MRKPFTVVGSTHRLQEPLSRRLAEMRTRLEDVTRCGVSFDAADLEALCGTVREAEHAVQSHEESSRDVNAAVPVAFGLVCQVEDELKVLRSLLSARHCGRPVDPDHQIAGAFARSIAFLEKGHAIVSGRTKP